MVELAGSIGILLLARNHVSSRNGHAQAFLTHCVASLEEEIRVYNLTDA